VLCKHSIRWTMSEVGGKSAPDDRMGRSNGARRLPSAPQTSNAVYLRLICHSLCYVARLFQARELGVEVVNVKIAFRCLGRDLSMGVATMKLASMTSPEKGVPSLEYSEE
jgi:hypothetical protein